MHAAVGELDRTEELSLEPVGVALVELLVGLPEAREREANLIGGLGEGVEQVLTCFGGGVGDRPRLGSELVVRSK
ncbi:MAG: hypothetical protein ACR2HD_10990 [Solirubrobacteraceae bacterium]